MAGTGDEQGARGLRARVRAEMAGEIMKAARAELERTGAAELSLRAVARRMGMVPSALYRYFPSRDALLTELIIQAYEALGKAAEDADPGGEDAMARWVAVARRVRAWAGQHRHEWELIYGSPVVGYQAPQATVAAALRITRAIVAAFADAVPVAPGASWDVPVPPLPPAPAGLGSVLAPTEELLLPGRPPEMVSAVLVAWTHLIGIVSLELFGHFTGATTDFDAVFDYTLEVVGSLVGLG